MQLQKQTRLMLEAKAEAEAGLSKSHEAKAKAGYTLDEAEAETGFGFVPMSAQCISVNASWGHSVHCGVTQCRVGPLSALLGPSVHI